MITLEVSTNHFIVAAASSRSYFPKWLLQSNKKTIAPMIKNESENRSSSSPSASLKHEEVGLPSSTTTTTTTSSSSSSSSGSPPTNRATFATHDEKLPDDEDDEDVVNNTRRHQPTTTTLINNNNNNNNSNNDNNNNSVLVVAGLSLMERAHVYAKLGKYHKSIELLERALQVQRQELGDRHVVLAQTLARRALVREHFGYWDGACCDLKQAVRIVEDVVVIMMNHSQQEQQQEQLQHEHPTLLLVIEHHRMYLAELLIKSGLMQIRRGQRKDGMISLEKALAIKRHVVSSRCKNSKNNDHGGDDASVADLVCLMAGVYHQQHDYIAASMKYTEALAMYKAARVPDDDDRVVEARRQAKRRNLLGHGFWTKTSAASAASPTATTTTSPKQSAVV